MFLNECDFFLNIWFYFIVYEIEDWIMLIMICGLFFLCFCIMFVILILVICFYKIKIFKIFGFGKCKLFYILLLWIKFNEM